jgi:Ca2+/Na+ antiporter
MIACLLQQQPSLALGNVIGSTIANILGAFALALWDHRGRMIFGPEAKIYTCVLFAVTSIFTILALKGQLDFTGGIFFLQGFVVYLAAIGFGIDDGLLTSPIDENVISDPLSARIEPSESTPLLPTSSNNISPRIGQRIEGIFNNTLRVLVGLIGLSISSFVMSHSTLSLATTFSVSAALLGATVLSLCTALLPKIIRRVQSGVHSPRATVLASTIASNIVLLTLCMGVILVVNPEGNKELAATVITFEIWSVWVSSIVLMFIVWIRARKWMGGLLLGFYAAYIGSEFIYYNR